jgi:hypothetical protein
MKGTCLYFVSLGLLFALVCVGDRFSSAQLNHNTTSETQHPGDDKGLSSQADLDGYRLLRIHSDPVLGKRWATLISCDHAERPAFTIPIADLSDSNKLQCSQQASNSNAQEKQVVHAGERIHVWKHESVLRIEVAGVAEEAGSLGQKIRVRIVPLSLAIAAPPEHLSGTVRGPANVEIQP